jgi:CBS domain-containing protein
MTNTQETTDRAGAFACLETLTARDVMGGVCGTIRADASAREAVDRFLTGPCRHLIVIDEDGRCTGVVGPRHIAQAHRLDLRRDDELPVGELGCGPWVVLGPDDSLRTCAQMLVEHDLDAIPVVDAGRRVIGVVTAHAVARSVADAPAPRRPARQG